MRTHALLSLIAGASGFSGPDAASQAPPAPLHQLSPEQRPHLVMAVVDDLGFAGLGYSSPTGEPRTPIIDALAAESAVLEAHYAFRFCSPSRSSFLSGRLPLHVNMQNHPPDEPGGGVPVGASGQWKAPPRAPPRPASHWLPHRSPASASASAQDRMGLHTFASTRHDDDRRQAARRRLRHGARGQVARRHVARGAAADPPRLQLVARDAIRLRRPLLQCARGLCRPAPRQVGDGGPGSSTGGPASAR